MKFYRLFICLLVLCSCKKESPTLLFSEINIINKGEVIIEINIPKAEGKTLVSDKINATLNDFVCQSLRLDASNEKQATIKASIKAFSKSYSNFNTLISSELKRELPIWEAFIDSEVIYKNENISCIAMNSSINTGTVQSIMVFKFFNFDNNTGNLLTTEELVNSIGGFKTLVKKYYNKEISSSFNDSEKLVNNNKFELPENLGFSDEGVIILYDNFDVGPFEKEILEFTIPYEIANDFLNI